MSDTEDQVTPEEALAAIEAVNDYIESGWSMVDMLDGFGFSEQSRWLGKTLGNLEHVIYNAYIEANNKEDGNE